MNSNTVKQQPVQAAAASAVKGSPASASKGKPVPANAAGSNPSQGQPAPGQKLPANPNAADLKQPQGQPAGKGQPPGKPASAGPPKPDAGPPPLPEGTSPQLQSAYQFLKDYVSNPQNVAQMNPAQMPDVGTDSLLNQVGNLLPKTISGSIKNYPNFSTATGSTPSPQLQTGVMPPNLVGGLSKLEVAMNQIPLPLKNKA
jgi:hypothetical protein